MNRHYRVLLYLLCGMMLMPAIPLAAAPLPGESESEAEIDWPRRLEQAYRGRRDRRIQEDSIKLCEAAIAKADLPADLRHKAFNTLFDIHRYRRERSKAIAASERYRAAYPERADIDQRTTFRIASMYREWKKHREKAIADLLEYIKRRATDKPSVAQAHLRVAEFQSAIKQYELAWKHAETALKLDGANLTLSVSALDRMQNAAGKLKQPERRLQPLRQLLTKPYLDSLDQRKRGNLRRDLGKSLEALKRWDDLRAFIDETIKHYESDKDRAGWASWRASTYYSEERYEQALAAYERVFVEYPRDTGQWYRAQDRIVSCLAKLGRHKEALSALRIVFDATTWDRGTQDRIKQMWYLFEEIDRNTKRANALLVYQRWGANGEDGKPGTKDDLKDPLDSVPYPKYPQREAAFTVAREQIGDTPHAEHVRAMTWVYSGHTTKALPHFVRALRFCRPEKIEDHGKVLVMIGMRHHQGHTLGLNEAMRYVASGSHGKDGKPGTDDDITEPFGDMPLTMSPSPVTPEERANLLRILDELKVLAPQPGDNRRREHLLRAMLRIVRTIELSDEQRGQLKTLATEQLLQKSEWYITLGWARLGEMAARQGTLSLQPSHAYWLQAKRTADQQKVQLHGTAVHHASKFMDHIRGRMNHPKRYWYAGRLRPPKRDQ